MMTLIFNSLQYEVVWIAIPKSQCDESCSTFVHAWRCIHCHFLISDCCEPTLRAPTLSRYSLHLQGPSIWPSQYQHPWITNKVHNTCRWSKQNRINIG